MVTGLAGDLDASAVTGTLKVTTGDASDNSITITTGSAATSITASGASDIVTVHASVLAQNTLLTLSGTAAFVVDGLVGDLNASALSGTLTVTTGDAADNAITITTGSAATSITTSGASDIVTVHASVLAQNTLLTLIGTAAFVVDGLVGDLERLCAQRHADGDHRQRHRQRHHDHHRVGRDLDHGDSGSDTVTVHAAQLANNTLLTLVGAADFVVDGLKGDLDASAVTGTLTATVGNASDNSITITTGSNTTSITHSFGSDIVTVHASALAQNTLLTLSGTAAFVVDGLVGDLNASAVTGALTVTTGNAADNAITITTGSRRPRSRRADRATR